MDRFHAAAALSLSLLTACGSPPEARHPDEVAATEKGGRVEPQTATEKQALAALDQLPSAASKQLGAETLSVDAPYLAASGQECRNVRLGQVARLACRDTRGWYFVPDVFGAEGAP